MTLSNLFTAANWPDLVGYVASALVVLSFVFKGVKLIRVINFTGCALFVVYGAFNDGGILWPIAIPNALLCSLHLYHLCRGMRSEQLAR